MKNKGSIKCFFYDVGNVLLDHRQAQKKFLEKLAWKLKMPLERIGGIFEEGVKSCWDEFECGKVRPMQVYENCLTVTRRYIPEKEWGTLPRLVPYSYFREAFGNVFVPMYRSIQFMRLIQVNGCQVWLVSNNNVIHYDYCMRAIPEVFSRVVNGCVLSHEVGFRKPWPEIYRIALQWSGFSPENVLAVDDKPANIEAARSLGMNGHVFTDVGSLKLDLEKNLGFHF